MEEAVKQELQDNKTTVETIHRNRWQKGQSGNPHGRPRAPRVEELYQAIKEVEQKKGKTLFQHLVERAFDNDQMLAVLLKKLIPDIIKLPESEDIQEGLVALLKNRAKELGDGNKITVTSVEHSRLDKFISK